MAGPSSDYGAGQASSATTTGQNAINSFDPNATAKSSNDAYSQFFGTTTPITQQNKDFYNQYQQAVAANPTVTSLYNKANQTFNVQPLAQNANTLQNAVLQAPQQTLDAARGFNYDQNQVANQTNLTLGRLSPLASAATNQAQTAQNLAGQYVQAGLQQNQFNLLPIQAQQQLLAQTQAEQATGFTQNNQQLWASLQAKMAQGVALSSNEMAMAQTLAQQQTAYQNALTAANASTSVAAMGAGQKLGANETYYNPFYTSNTYNPFYNNKISQPGTSA